MVKPFHLPKNQHPVLPSSSLPSTGGDHLAEIDEALAEPSVAAVSYPHPRDSPLHSVEDVEMGEVGAEEGPSWRSNVVPKSMRELAEDDLRRQASEINEPDRRSSERKVRGGMKSSINTSSTRNSSVKRKNKRKRIREDNSSASEVDHRFDSASTRDGHSMKGTPNTSSGRVLRPRPQKKAAKLREEEELERAFRRAIAE